MRQSRDIEQYLTSILNELHPPLSGQMRGIRYTVERGKRITPLSTRLMLTKPCFRQLRTNSRTSWLP